MPFWLALPIPFTPAKQGEKKVIRYTKINLAWADDGNGL